jgi:hypothetical protein
MERRYQVFVSSTFEDLREERAAVISALLQFDCFPTGMELFPASDDDSMTLIQKAIEDSDYYLVVIAGRYGSSAPGHRRSFTHMEYDYAVSIGKPTIALLHANPGQLPVDKTESTDEGRKRLEEFRQQLKRKNCKTWTDRGELTSGVFTGIQNLKKIRPAPGWVRGSELPDEALKDELLRLRRELESANAELAATRCLVAPEGAETLAQGADLIKITIEYSPEDKGVVSMYLRWDEIMRAVLPQSFGAGATPEHIASTLVSLVCQRAQEEQVASDRYVGKTGSILSRNDYGKVMNQMVALGLINACPDPARPGETRWVATPYGLQAGSRLVALPHPEFPF